MFYFRCGILLNRSVILLRMRKRSNLGPRMEKCAEYLIDDPAALRGKWLESFPGYDRLYLELGCGKGRFTADTAELMPDTLYIAMEKVPDAMILAMERVRERGIKNVRFIEGDAIKLAEMFAPGEAARIYINFCDPWPKSRDAKHRLTFPGFLRLYADVLPLGGEIHFKTDNTPLFSWSLEQFENEGWALSEKTNDLHANGPVVVMTDYEAKFHAQGFPINRVVAVKTEATKGMAAGPAPRMYKAALTDAHGYEDSMNSNAGEKHE